MRVCAIATLFLMPLLPGAILGQGAAAQPENQPEIRGYTCCNLHYEDDWISDANWSSLPMIPAGTPIRTSSYARYSITVEIDHPWYTRKMRLGLDYGRKQRLADWARLIIVPENPKPRIATWPEHIRNAVRDGQVAIGMTKEQLIAAVGYPPAHQTPTLDAPQWKYWHTTHGTFNVIWSKTDHVEDVIDGDPFNPTARAAVLASGALSTETPPPSKASQPTGVLPLVGTQ